jgi:hypothetical protein
MTELEKLLKRIIDSKDSEATLASFAGCNVKVPTERQAELTEILQLDAEETELLEELYKLEPEEIIKLFTLALMAKGTICDFIKAERNTICLKHSALNWAKDHPEYRKTSVDINENDPKRMLDALIMMRKMIENNE